MMKRRIVLLITTIVIANFFLYTATAEKTIQYDNKAIETTKQLCAFMGQPSISRAEDLGLNDTKSPVNARIMFISKNNDDWRLDIIIRASEDICFVWRTGLTRINLLCMVKFVLDEEASFLYPVYTVNGEIKDYTYYYFDNKDKLPYSTFLSNFDRILQYIDMPPLPVYINGDTFLSDFSGVFWYDDIEVVKERLQQFTLDISKSDDASRTTCSFIKKIDGYDIQYNVDFINDTLRCIEIRFPEYNTRSLYLDQMKSVYGDPIDTNMFAAAFLGYINRQNEADCLFWYNDFTEIMYPLQVSDVPTNNNIIYYCRDHLQHLPISAQE